MVNRSNNTGKENQETSKREEANKETRVTLARNQVIIMTGKIAPTTHSKRRIKKIEDAGMRIMQMINQETTVKIASPLSEITS